METPRERSRPHNGFGRKVLTDGLGSRHLCSGENGAAGSAAGESLLLQGSSVVCRACRSFHSGSSGQKQPLLLDQPFPLGIGSRVVTASLVHLDCRCPCFRVWGGCHCDRQRGRSSELGERLGCCEGSLLLVLVTALPYIHSVLFPQIWAATSEPKLSLQLCLSAILTSCCLCSSLPPRVLSSLPTFIAHSSLELLTAFLCPHCPPSCGNYCCPP